MKLRTYPGNQFTWSQGQGTACASDLGIGAGDPWPHSFFVRSHRTGERRLFLPGEDLYTGNDYDREFAGKKYFTPGGNCAITLFND